MTRRLFALLNTHAPERGGKIRFMPAPALFAAQFARPPSALRRWARRLALGTACLLLALLAAMA
jgi:hypothetical protein